MTTASPAGSPVGSVGTASANSAASMFNAMTFLVWSILTTVRTAMPVQVIAVTNTGLDVPAGLVDVQPIVLQMDGAGNGYPHAPVHNVPYFRLQAGTNAVILDPVIGDVGVMVICDRDWSKVKSAAALGPFGSGFQGLLPDSWRQFDMADGIYLGGLLGALPPTQFVSFSAAGITITSPTAVTINAPEATINGNVQVNGTVTASGIFTGANFAAGTVDLLSHVHTGVQAGGDTTGGPEF